MQFSRSRSAKRATVMVAACALTYGCGPTGEGDVETAQSPQHGEAADISDHGGLSAASSSHLFSYSGNALTARNAALHAQLHAAPDGMTLDLLPQDGDAEEAETLTIRTVGISRGDERKATSAAGFAPGQCASDGRKDSAGACVRRAEAQHEGLIEWWENRASVVEHGFDVAQRPFAEAEGLLTVELEVLGAEAEVRNAGALTDLRLPSGKTLYYGALLVIDARGVELPSRLVSTTKGMAIEIDDLQATYPIRIDPAVSGASWGVESNLSYAQFGTQVASAGDVNGDGYGDVIIGARGWWSTTAEVPGRIYIYLGSSAGLSTTPALTFGLSLNERDFGAAVAGAGDLNGDGLDDVVIGSPSYSNGELSEGRVCVLFGTNVGTTGVAASSLTCRESNLAGARLGFSVAGAGDVNGDGLADLIAGAPEVSNSESSEGAAYVYYGATALPGLSASAAWVHEGNLVNARMGRSVAGAGDVNGNGIGDVVIAGDRQARVFYGTATGLPSAASWTSSDLDPADASDLVVAAAGDVNGDSYGDVLVGIPAGEGSVQVLRGSIFGLAGFPTPLIITPAMANPNPNQPSQGFGAAVSSAGDLNGDGRADIVIGAPYAGVPNGGSSRGAAFALFGGANNVFTPAASMVGTAAGAMLGRSVASAGDVNGDGLSELIVGAPGWADTHTIEGAAYAWYSSPSSALIASPPLTPGTGQGILPTPLAPSTTSPGFGAALAHVGDINGDGFGDAVFGDPNRSNGQANEGALYVQLGNASGISTFIGQIVESNLANVGLGSNVAAAGDVNGDGYADVLVNSLHGANAAPNQRGIYVYLGSSSGLATTPWWWAQGATGSLLGAALAGAGDINGDGYSDIVVGEPNYASGAGLTAEGRFIVYLGSATTMQPYGWLRSNMANTRMGSAVAMGDANGDALSDVLVGVPGLGNGSVTNHGTALLFFSSASGLSNVPGWAGNPNLTVSARYGTYLAFGDVTGDGRDDVLVGAPNYGSSTQTRNAGAVYLYVASSTGTIPTVPTRLITATDADVYMGAVSVGDTNGDGFSDIGIGLYGMRSGSAGGLVGQARIYLGSASGQAPPFFPDANYTVTGTRLNYGLGARVDLAGDLNGDGYADLLTGAPFAGTLLPDNAIGSAYALLGHSHSGKPLESVPQLRRAGTATPIAALGRAFSTTSFDVAFKRARAVSRNGYARVEVETKAAGVPFDRNALVKGTWTQLGSGGALAVASVNNSSIGNAPHVRARLAYHPGRTLPWMRTSAWFYLGVPGHPQGAATRLR